METLKEMELEILIAIRNNETIESNQFYKIFENQWPHYKECVNILHDRGLFISANIQAMPGLKKYELTKEGNNRISQLLSERTHAVHVKLAHLRRSKNIESSHRPYSLVSLFAFFAHVSGRFKRHQAH